MSAPIIRVEGLGKRYRLGEFGAGSLREELERLGRRMGASLRPNKELSKEDGSQRSEVGGQKSEVTGQNKEQRTKNLEHPATRDFWALRDVSFEVQAGELLGVIGRNGAGKSTLLKLLSRITEPTEGEAFLNGRVASLLEVGTGFHPELTGRDNIYLSGTIMGMSRTKIRKRFDEIVAFAGLEQFVDTPVKRYSSGMYVRLGFAVAAHLESEILIVDEVLAVGDANFREKCVEKMKEVTNAHGRTVLFVSHNMAVIRNLCPRTLLLESGRLVMSGGTDEALTRYVSDSAGGEVCSWINPSPTGYPVEFESAEVHILGPGNPRKGEVAIDLVFAEGQTVVPWVVGVRVEDMYGVELVVSHDVDHRPRKDLAPDTRHRMRYRLPVSILRPGRYFVSLGIAEMGAANQFSKSYGHFDRVMSFQVTESDYPFPTTWQNVIADVGTWEFGAAN